MGDCPEVDRLKSLDHGAVLHQLIKVETAQREALVRQLHTHRFLESAPRANHP